MPDLTTQLSTLAERQRECKTPPGWPNGRSVGELIAHGKLCDEFAEAAYECDFTALLADVQQLRAERLLLAEALKDAILPEVPSREVLELVARVLAERVSETETN